MRYRLQCWWQERLEPFVRGHAWKALAQRHSEQLMRQSRAMERMEEQIADLTFRLHETQPKPIKRKKRGL